jgi:single-strand DNA-binding protein
MANVNIVILAGNLTADPELRYTPSGMAVAQLRMAVNNRYKDSKTNEWREEATFVDVDLFGKQAETAKQYLSKGRSVMIEGRLKLDQWEDKQTGAKRSRLKVIATRMQFLGAPPSGGGGGARGGGEGKPNRSAQGQQAQAASAQEPPSQDENLDIPEEEIPF